MTGLAWKVDRRPQVIAQVRRAAAAALSDGAEFGLEQANRTAPIEEGTLIRSGTTDVDRSALKAVISYDTPYAVRQHEDTRLRHDSGRRAKWLEATLREQSRRIVDFMAGRIRAAVR